MKFTFTGTNVSGQTGVGGYVFPTGTPVEVEDADTIRRLTGHPEFEAVAEDKPIAQPVVKRRAKRTSK